MGVVDQKSDLSKGGLSSRGLIKSGNAPAERARALERRQAQLDAQKGVDIKRKAKQQLAKLQSHIKTIDSVTGRETE